MLASLVAVLLLQGAPPQPALSVTGVVAERLSFRPSRGETAAWRYRTSRSARVKASIYDARDVLVRALLDGADLEAGDHTLSWDGRDDKGRPAPPAYYLLAIEAAAGGDKVRFDPSESTGGTLLAATDVKADAAKNVVRYALEKPSLVRILLGLKKDGPLLRTLVDWVARGAGEHVESWDGWDASGAIQFGASPDLDVQVWAYDLPVNAVVVVGGAADPADATLPAASSAPSASPPRLEFLDFEAGRAVRERGARKPHEVYNHWMHDRARCHDPKIRLEAPESTTRAADGAVSVGAPTPLRLAMAPEEGSFLQEERFEAVVYLDGAFVFEEEQGYLPFTWMLKPDLLTPGEHVITFMARGYEGHFGTASLKVFRPGAVAAAGR
jgi:flagellar hook capping protein FlgD